MTLEHETYASAEQELKLNGFKREEGCPLDGVRFTSENGFAFVFRVGKGKYDIVDFAITPEKIYNFVRENPIKKSTAIKMIKDYARMEIEKKK